MAKMAKDCLHCHLRAFIIQWIEEHPDADYEDIGDDLSGVVAEYICHASNEYERTETRKEWIQFMDDTIEVILKSEETIQ